MGRGRGGRGKGGSAYGQDFNVQAQYAQQPQYAQAQPQYAQAQPQYVQQRSQGYPVQQGASPGGSLMGAQYAASPTNVRAAAPAPTPAAAPAPAPQEVEDSMVIDKDNVKFLIGPQGKTVSQIRKSTKAQVTVTEAPAGSKFGKVTMKGTPAQVADARARITQVLATAETPMAEDKAKEAKAAKAPEKPVVKGEPEPEKTPSEEGKAKLAERKAKLKTFLASPTCSKLAMGVGGVSGGGTGAMIGTAVGLPAALFTFGLSIPVCASVGGVVGGAVGVASGKVVGLGLGKVAQKL